jgi:cyclopropane fatty-acyl-phospholipid synthase-like methyltransferase
METDDMADINHRVDFDHFTESYQDLLREQLALFSSDHGYFSTHKARLVADLLGPDRPAGILDFGCGIGLNLPALADAFPGSALHASDISVRSLDHVGRTYPTVRTLNDGELEAFRFDLIFVAGVLHHVPVRERPALLRRLAGLLTPKGTLCVFEHNPYNPVTRHLVSTCPFDGDAVLLSRREMHRLFSQAAGLRIRRSAYCLFFPPRLGAFQRLEDKLAWLPLGGQYLVAGTR